MERAQSVNGQRSQMGMSLLMGILLPSFAAYCYLRYGNLPCDKPVGGWLYTYAMVGLILGVCQLYVNCVQLARAQRLAAAASLPDSPRRQAAAVDVFATDHSVACLTCCVTLPLGIFQFLWWIKGNFDVWGTYPRDNISSMEGPVGGAVTFEGCERDLLNSARLIYIASYIVIGISVVFLCTICAIVASAIGDLAVEVVEETRQQGAARGMV